MHLAGSPFAHELDFSTGLPTGAVVYSVLGNDNLPVSGYEAISVYPPAGALSLLIIVPGTINTVSTPLFETRTLSWTYPTEHGVENGRKRYRVVRDIVFPVTPEGVRAKLGIEDHELPDERIDLLSAYATLSNGYEAGALDAYATAGDSTTLLIADAIEAMAGLEVVSSLQLAVARKESSGTNSYERFANMDWDSLRAQLYSYIGRLNDILVPLVDPTTLPVIFLAVERDDPVTGTAAGS